VACPSAHPPHESRNSDLGAGIPTQALWSSRNGLSLPAPRRHRAWGRTATSYSTRGRGGNPCARVEVLGFVDQLALNMGPVQLRMGRWGVSTIEEVPMNEGGETVRICLPSDRFRVKYISFMIVLSVNLMAPESVCAFFPSFS
jgi:hypothetical protein